MSRHTAPERPIDPFELYDLLCDYAAGPQRIDTLVIGLVWTCCQAGGMGLSMSPGVPTRTLPWAGTLSGRSISELACWVREFDPYRATVGMAAINAGINNLGALPEGVDLPHRPGGANNLSVFEHFLPELAGKRIVVVGRYPGLDQFAAAHQLDLKVLERQPGPDDLPDSACEFLLPTADWVFLTSTSIPNKTFPRLAALCADATTVLMGPTTPWIPDLYHFGIDFLAGVVVDDPGALFSTVCEGGGVRIFDGPVHYRVVALNPASAKKWARSLIAETAAERESLKTAMEKWYAEQSEPPRFPETARIEAVGQRLSRLDTCFKRLWDQHPDDASDWLRHG